MYQERLNDWYQTHQTAFGLKESCIGKLDRCNDRKICGKLSVNETVETPVTSTCLSADCIELKFDRMSSKLMHTELPARYKHQMQIAIRKESWRWINWNRPLWHKVESLICCWYPICTYIALKRTSLLQAYLIFFFLILYEVWKWNHRDFDCYLSIPDFSSSTRCLYIKVSFSMFSNASLGTLLLSTIMAFVHFEQFWIMCMTNGTSENNRITCRSIQV